MLSYDQYPEEKSRLYLSSFKTKLINRHGGLLDVTTTKCPKSCAYHPVIVQSHVLSSRRMRSSR